MAKNLCDESRIVGERIDWGYKYTISTKIIEAKEEEQYTISFIVNTELANRDIYKCFLNGKTNDIPVTSITKT